MKWCVAFFSMVFWRMQSFNCKPLKLAKLIVIYLCNHFPGQQMFCSFCQFLSNFRLIQRYEQKKIHLKPIWIQNISRHKPIFATFFFNQASEPTDNMTKIECLSKCCCYCCCIRWLFSGSTYGIAGNLLFILQLNKKLIWNKMELISQNKIELSETLTNEIISSALFTSNDMYEKCSELACSGKANIITLNKSIMLNITLEGTFFSSICAVQFWCCRFLYIFIVNFFFHWNMRQNYANATFVLTFWNCNSFWVSYSWAILQAIFQFYSFRPIKK